MKIGICDDDHRYLSYVREILEKYGEEHQLDLEVFTAGGGDQLFAYSQTPPDVVFMDIELQSENGIELAKKINTLWKNCQVIFLTNYLLYATDVYETKHIYFVLKNDFSRRLEDVFRKISAEYDQKKSRLLLKLVGEGEHSVSQDDILYLERKSRKTYVCTREGEYIVWDKLDLMKAQLLPGAFVRCHNSYIVYLPAVAEMKSSSFILNNGAEIPISRNYRESTREAFARWALLQVS